MVRVRECRSDRRRRGSATSGSRLRLWLVLCAALMMSGIAAAADAPGGTPGFPGAGVGLPGGGFPGGTGGGAGGGVGGGAGGVSVPVPANGVQIKIDGFWPTFNATVEGGAIVIRNASSNSVVSLQVIARMGITLSLTADGQGVQVAGGTGTATVRCNPNMSATVGPGRTAAFTPMADGRGTSIKAVAGTITGTMDVACDTSRTLDFTLTSNSAGSFMTDAACTRSEVGCVSGTVTLTDNDGMSAALDGSNTAHLSQRTGTGEITTTVVTGDGIAITTGSTTTNLPNNQSQTMTSKTTAGSGGGGGGGAAGDALGAAGLATGIAASMGGASYTDVASTSR